MTVDNKLFRFPLGRILPVVLAFLLTLCVGPVCAAPEPGTVTVVLAAEPATLDASEHTASSAGKILAKNIFETLTLFNPDDGSITPGLATSWKQVDTKTWHFFLRKGVKFHDGADFNAEAFLFNIKRLYEKRIVNSIRRKYFGNLTIEGKALDSHTIELKADRAEPAMLMLLSNMPMVSPSTQLDKWTRNPMGTGPFKLARWDAGSQIILERFDGYWGKLPQVKKAVYVWRAESSVRAAMVKIGEADLAPDITRQDANSPDMDCSYLNAETTSLRFGGQWDPPLNDRRVRLALTYAIDRDAIRGSVLSKDVIPATQVNVPSIFGYNPNLKLYPYDPEKARKLMDEARKDGVPVDREILLINRTGYFPGSGELMEVVLNSYRAVGLNLKLRSAEVATHSKYRDKPYPAGLYIIANSHGNATGDAVFGAFMKYHCKGQNSVMCDKQVDDLIEKAQVASGEERRSLWHAVFKRIQEEIIPDAMLFHMVGYARVGKRINFKPSLATNSEISLAEIAFKP